MSSNQQDKMLQIMINQRISRAVQRLFSQNSPDKVQNIYDSLQNKIRVNSNQLRQTLYRKYNNLINCSQILDGLNSFAKDLNGISQSMNKIIKQRQFQYQQQFHSKTKIQRIEFFMYKNNFLEAMTLSCKSNKLQNQNQSLLLDQYYIKYLKIEIIQKMQKYINKTKFDRNLVNQIIQTLKLFLRSFQNIQKQFKQICNGRKKGILTVLYSYIKQDSIIKNNQKLRQEQSQFDLLLVRCLFEYKLTTLGYCKSQQLIFNFFYDLLELSKQSNDQRLKILFQQNWNQMGQNLSHIFIHQVQQPQGLKFQYELYQKLLNSRQFLDLFEKIQKNLNLNEELQIIKSFQKLWESYYHQLIDHISNQINPLNYIKNLEKSQKYRQQDVPPQFLPYRVDRSIEDTFKIRKKYQNLLKSVTNNMNLLCQKGKIDQVIKYFDQKIQNINAQIKQYFVNKTTHVDKKSFLYLRQVILLHLILNDFKNVKQQDQIKWASNSKIERPFCIEHFSQLFNNAKKSFQVNMIELDSFFTCYSVPYLNLKDLPVIQQIILQILNSLKKSNHQLSERYVYIIKKLKNQPQPMSIFKASLPNIAQYIFLIKMQSQQLLFDIHTYKKYLKKSETKRESLLSQNQKINQNINNLLNQVDDDAFEIGQKQTIEEMIQIGVKSMKTMGNFISGFMKKN